MDHIEDAFRVGKEQDVISMCYISLLEGMSWCCLQTKRALYYC